MGRSGKLMQIATTGPGAARRFVRSSMSGWDDSAGVEDAVLLVSELVSSALHHGATATTVDAVVSPSWVRIEVHDAHGERSGRPGTPRRAPVPIEGEGYAVVDALASDWGIVEEPAGTTVWFELQTGRRRNGRSGPTDG